MILSRRQLNEMIREAIDPDSDADDAAELRDIADDLESGDPIISEINSIPMYRGTRSGDPGTLPSGITYFISNEMYAKTYGPTAEFRLNIKNPKIVDREVWVNTYDTIALRMNPNTLGDLREEGYDSVVMKMPTAMPIYVVMVLAAEESVR